MVGLAKNSALSPYSKIGSRINVVACSLLTVGLIAAGIIDPAFGFGGALIGVILTLVFLGIAATVTPSGSRDSAEGDHPSRNGVIHNYPSARARFAEGKPTSIEPRSRRRGGGDVVHNYPSAPPDRL